MSDAPVLRRADKLMDDARIEEMLSSTYSGRLGTIGADGWPYVCPLLFVMLGGEVWVHNTGANGHLRRNVLQHGKVCFELDVPGKVFPYGRFECDTSIEYRSVVVFGLIRIVDDTAQKIAFFDKLMAKYCNENLGRPKGFYPQLDKVTVYAIAIERITGKQTSLPTIEAQWPSADHTRTPLAKP